MTLPFSYKRSYRLPLYNIENTESGEIREMSMKISELEIFLKENPHCKQLLSKAPSIGDPIKLGRKKPDPGFRELLRRIKKNNRHSNINTF